MRPLLATLLASCTTCFPVRGSEELPLDQWLSNNQKTPPHAKASLLLPPSVMIGEEIPAKLVIENTGTEDFEISVGGDYRATGFPERIKVRVRNAAGDMLPELPREAYGFGGGGLMGMRTIPPGAREEIKFPLDCYVNFSGPGVYTITAGHDLGWKIDKNDPHPLGVTTLKVAEPNEAQAAAIVQRIFDSHAKSPPGSESERLGQESTLEHQLCVLRHPVYLTALKERASAGSIQAVKGIGHITNLGATKELIDLLDHPTAKIVETACWQLQGRIPSREDETKPGLPRWWASRYQIDPLLPTCWDPRFEKLLADELPKLIARTDPQLLEAVGRMLEVRGSDQHAPAIMAALQVSLDTYREPVSGPKANTLDAPLPQKSLIAALDTLRARGWRAEKPGGTAGMVAWFRQLADETIPKPPGEDWRSSMLTWVENGPPTLKVSALESLPLPLSDRAAKTVGNALEDPDWRVQRIACEVAGRSRRPEFARRLVHIVELQHETFLQNAAHQAAFACGARLELWEAWANVITNKDRMYEAISALVHGTIDLGPSSGGGGSSNFTREQRFVIRDAWKSFLQKHQETLAAGKKVPPPVRSVSSSLIGTDLQPDNPALRIDLKDGSVWPPEPID